METSHTEDAKKKIKKYITIWNILNAAPNSLHPTSTIHFRIWIRVSRSHQIPHLSSLPQAVCLSIPLTPASCLICWSFNSYTHTMITWRQARGCQGKATPTPPAHLTSQHLISMKQIHSRVPWRYRKLFLQATLCHIPKHHNSHIHHDNCKSHILLI